MKYPFRRPNGLFYLFIISIPFFGFSVFNIGDRGLPLNLLLALALDVYFISGLLKGRRLHVSGSVFLVLLLNLSALLSLVGVFNESFSSLVDFSTVFVQVIISTVLAVAISHFEVGQAQIRRMFQVWILTAIAVAVFGLYQGVAEVSGLPEVSLQMTNASYSSLQRTGGAGASDFLRRTSIFGEPSWYGGYILFPLLLVLFSIIGHCDRHVLFEKRWKNWITLVVLGLGLLQSGSAGAYGTFVATMAFFLVRERKLQQGRRLAVALAAVLIVAISVSSWLDRPIVGYFFETTTRLGRALPSLYLTSGRLQSEIGVASLNRRLNVMSYAVSDWLTKPVPFMLLGSGLNYYERHSVDIGLPVDLKGVPNLYLQTLLDQGLIGLAIWVTLFLKILMDLKRKSRPNKPVRMLGSSNPDEYWQFLSQVFFYIILSLMVKLTLVSASHYEWFVLGVAMLIARRARLTLRAKHVMVASKLGHVA